MDIMTAPRLKYLSAARDLFSVAKFVIACVKFLQYAAAKMLLKL